MNDANKALIKEESNGDFWLHPSTKEKIMGLTIKLLVTDRAQQITNKSGGVTDFFK